MIYSCIGASKPSSRQKNPKFCRQFRTLWVFRPLPALPFLFSRDILERLILYRLVMSRVTEGEYNLNQYLSPWPRKSTGLGTGLIMKVSSVLNWPLSYSLLNEDVMVIANFHLVEDNIHPEQKNNQLWGWRRSKSLLSSKNLCSMIMTMV